MNFINLLKVAFHAIANNKFRSFLSMLGIIIGVAAVIIMMAIGQGSKESVRKNMHACIERLQLRYVHTVHHVVFQQL